MIMCQPMVMMLVSSFHRELTSTIGPGSMKRRTSETGKSFFLKFFTASLAGWKSHANPPRRCRFRGQSAVWIGEG
jgi:hypothetical protein